MVSMAAYGMIGASLSNAVPIAQERASGWTRQLRITPLPAPAWIATKLAVAYLTALPSLVLVGLAAVLVNHVSLPAGTWLAIGLSLALGRPAVRRARAADRLHCSTSASAQRAVMISYIATGDPRRPLGAGVDVPGRRSLRSPGSCRRTTSRTSAGRASSTACRTSTDVAFVAAWAVALFGLVAWRYRVTELRARG